MLHNYLKSSCQLASKALPNVPKAAGASPLPDLETFGLEWFLLNREVSLQWKTINLKSLSGPEGGLAPAVLFVNCFDG